MATFENERAVVRAARERLEEWLFDARSRAYADMFEGDEATFSERKLRQLDRLDSELSRQNGDGLWGTDRYGIVPGSEFAPDSTPRVVCLYHPQIPDDAIPGERSLDETARERYNEALWSYCELVAEYVQEDLETYLASV